MDLDGGPEWRTCVLVNQGARVMTSPEKKPVGVFDLARRDETGIHPEPEEGVFLSPWGTEGCQWDLDYSYLEDDDPPGESGQPEPTKP